jgi:FAD dependent oxidoreductase TIGR03364
MAGRVVIVGGGVLGTWCALEARERDWEVVHLERDHEPRSATVRNFGLVWVSGRSPGTELEAALRARQRWEQLGEKVPGLGFRPDGSITVVSSEEAEAVLAAVCARADADQRGFELLAPAEVRRRNPALRGRFRAGLWCGADAVVEPGGVLPALREHLNGPGYHWLPGRTAVALRGTAVVDQTGEVHAGDLLLVCPGARADGPVGELLEGAPVRRVRLQMLQTEPLGETLATSLADEDSLRYYPAFAGSELSALPAQDPDAARVALQLLVSQRRTGELTVGDTHEYDEPFDFAVDEGPYRILADRLRAILGREVPPIRRRWAGMYSQHTGGGLCHRARVASSTWVLTGPGGRGMTLAPALAQDTWDDIEQTEVGA